MAVMLTTEDNPYDPRLDYLAWNAWDIAHGYHTSSYLARVLMDAEELPQVMRDRQIEDAIDEIIREHAGGIYKKLTVEPT